MNAGWISLIQEGSTVQIVTARPQTKVWTVPANMTATFVFVLLLVTLALVFDYINGFHDAANSIATVVSTRVLSTGMAVIWAAFFNFIAFAVFGTRVAKSIGDGVRLDLIAVDWRLYVLLAALMGAIIWNLITCYLGLPTSSSHALLGGYAGAGGIGGLT